tara:strand:+ start:8525 stop:8734 length:210 start_codon:yes stop_codon:yes gene_type:complete
MYVLQISIEVGTPDPLTIPSIYGFDVIVHGPQGKQLSIDAPVPFGGPGDGPSVGGVGRGFGGLNPPRGG